MKKIPNHVPLWLVILIVLIILLIMLIVIFTFIENTKSISLIGGLIGGLVVYIANFLSEKWALQRLIRFQRMKIHNLLSNRHDKSYYRNMLDNVSNEVKVMGATCSRFIDDFLDIDSDDKVLIERLRQCPELTIQLLIPNDDNMGADARSRFAIVTHKLKRVMEEFDGRIQVRHFACDARHSFVISDTELIAGPIFAEDKSKHAPAVHVDVDTDFGRKYREHFDQTWKQCKYNESIENFD